MPTRSVLRLAAIVVGALVSLAYARTIAPGITWANYGADGAELAAAALVNGVAHPSGYPTYLLLADLFLALPGAEPAFKLNLLSATAALLTTLVIFATVAQLAPPSPWRSVAAALAALGLGFAPLFWSQALITEVYALGALFGVVLLRSTLVQLVAGVPVAFWPAAATSLLAGLALGNHLAVLPFSLIWLVVATRFQPHWLARGALVAWFGLGLLVYLILPLRAASLPPINWGGAHHWDGFWWLVRGQLYTGLAFAIPFETLPDRILTTLQTLMAQLGLVGLTLISYGLVRIRHARAWSIRWASLVPAGLIIGFTLGYASYDATVYLVLALPSLALWVGLGLAESLARLSFPTSSVGPVRWLPILVSSSVALALFLAWPANLRTVDARTDHRASNYAHTIMTQAPDRSLIFTFRDHDSFPLWYYHLGQSRRPDVVLVTAPLLGFPWYRESLQATYPHLHVPETALLGWEHAIAQHYADQGPICRTQLEAEPILVCATPTP
ncbi:MAG: protein O-mannosyl-transferase family [Oscillochloridaceae bacterium umkhey_bin13]